MRHPSTRPTFDVRAAVLLVALGVAGALIAPVFAPLVSRGTRAQEQYANNCSTTLNNGGTMGSGDTSVVVTSGTCFPSSGNFRVIIGTEIIIVGARSGTTLSSLTRGAEGTSAATHADGSTLTHIITAASLRNLAPYSVANGRVTTESGVPVSSSDRTAQSTIYWTPADGGQIGLYDGSDWIIHVCTEKSLSLSSLTSGKNYDVFMYVSSATCALELSAAWTSDTARNDAIALQDGVEVKSGTTTRRLIATIRTTGTTTTEDSQAKRFVWNRYNQVARDLYHTDSTSSWNYTTNTWQQARAQSSNQVEYVTGSAATIIDALVKGNSFNANSSGVSRGVAVGLDSTTTPSGVIGIGGVVNSMRAEHNATYVGQPGLGYHFIAALEASGTGNTTTWAGTITLGGTTSAANGIFVRLRM